MYAVLLTSTLAIFIDNASDQGIPKSKGKYFIISFSVADLVGRWAFVQFIDRNKESRWIKMEIKNHVDTIFY